MSFFCYQNDMFPLAWWNTWCWNSPAVFPHYILVIVIHHQYRFYREGHSGSHYFPRCLTSVHMINHWRHVHLVRDPMTSKVRIHYIAMSMSLFSIKSKELVLLNDLPYFGETFPRLHYINSCIHSLSSDLTLYTSDYRRYYQFLDIWMYIT